MRLTVLEAGPVGARVGCEYALAGYEVVFCDRDVAAAAERVAAALEAAELAGLRSPGEAADVMGRLSRTTSVSDASEGSDAIIDFAADDLALKGRLLREAASAAPEALLATSTSSLRVTDIGREAGAAARVVGTYFGSSAGLPPFVEVAGGEDTAHRCIRSACDLVAAVGRTPIVRRDIQGSVWIRLQLAIIRECVLLVEQGVISSEAIDEIVREGLARRWRHVGPYRALVLGGLDTWNALARNVAPALSASPELPDLRTFARAPDRETAAATGWSET
jgi:3-hydroxybutyryl-CoA dehydrogenase